MNETLYKCADFFLSRTSLLPLEQSFSSSDLLDFSKNNPLFLEAIANASPTLFKAIQKCILNPSACDLKKLDLGILKYFLRMTYRATPFGLFSFVRWGNFELKTDLNFNLESVKKNVRPDMEWVQYFIEIFRKDPNLIKNFKIMLSPYVYNENQKFYLKTFNSTSNKQELTSIKSTDFTKQAMKLAAFPISYYELENHLVSLFSQYDQEKVKISLWDIYQRGFFISELFFPLNKPFDINNFIHLLNEKIHHSSNQESQDALDLLKKISEGIAAYIDRSLGSGISQLQDLFECANLCKGVEHPLHVDSFVKDSKAKLSQTIQSILEEVASLLFHLTHHFSRNEHISKYHKQFLEKYGTTCLVPIEELVSPTFGLGMPLIDQTKKTKHTYLDKIVFEKLSQGLNEIQLEDVHCQLNNLGKIEKAPLSLELFFELIANSPEDLDRGNYQIVMNPVVASNQAGSTFGRFLYLWDSAQIQQLMDFLSQEEKLLPHIAFVEASFQALKTRIANVCFHQNTRKHQLHMFYHDLSETILELKDICVGANENRLYLFSKKLNKEIKIVSNTAVNQELSPPVLKLLWDISEYGQNHFSPFICEEIMHFIYIPRMRYKNVILSPARWYFSYENLKIKKEAEHGEVSSALKKAFIDHKVPLQIFLTEFDNRLLLDHNNEQEFKILLDQFIAKREVILLEGIGKNSSLIQSDKGQHVTEFVVPLVKRTHPLSTPNLVPNQGHVSKTERIQCIGNSNWLYAKIYLPVEFEQEFIWAHLKNFAGYLRDNQWIDQWFYVRYTDEKSHIRFRMHGECDVLINQALPALSKWASSLMANKIITEFSFHSYEREVERYGGPKLIEPAEEIFCHDSDNCAVLLELHEKKSLEYSLQFLAALGIINILRSCFPDIQAMVDFLSGIEKDLVLLSGLRSQLKQFVKTTSDLFFDKSGSQQEIVERMQNLSDLVKKFHEEMNLQGKENLWNQQEHIIDSFIHMHCNRLLGVDNELEKKARAIAYFTLKKCIHTETTTKAIL